MRRLALMICRGRGGFIEDAFGNIIGYRLSKLQYVRMNGTLVGALAGGTLFAVLHAVFGRVVG